MKVSKADTADSANRASRLSCFGYNVETKQHENLSVSAYEVFIAVQKVKDQQEVIDGLFDRLELLMEYLEVTYVPESKQTTPAYVTKVQKEKDDEVQS